MNEYVRQIGFTEDGDVRMVRRIEVDSVAEAREVTKSLEEEVDRRGNKAHFDITWVGKGGKLVWEDKWVVDGAEVAIERNNDYYASMRDMAFSEESYW